MLRAKGFVNSNAKIWGQRLTDGMYATVYNPSEFRWPLAISLSKDGLEYTTLNLVQLSGSIESRKYWSNGIDFRHTQHSIGWDVAATFMYKNFTASVEFQHNSDYFFGEVLATGEEAHAIDLQYRWKRLNVGLRMFNPFQKDYKRNEEDWNKYAGYSYQYHIDDVARMICVTLSWNINFGRDYKSHNKKMQNSDTDAGVL